MFTPLLKAALGVAVSTHQRACCLPTWLTCGHLQPDSLPGYASIALILFGCPGIQEFACSIRHCPIISGAMFAGSLSAQTVNSVLKTASVLCPTDSMGRSNGFLAAFECAAVNSFGSLCMQGFKTQFTSNY